MNYEFFNHFILNDTVGTQQFFIIRTNNYVIVYAVFHACNHLEHTHSTHSRPVPSFSSSANVRKQIQYSSVLISVVDSVAVVAIDIPEVEAEEGVFLLVDLCFFMLAEIC